MQMCGETQRCSLDIINGKYPEAAPSGLYVECRTCMRIPLKPNGDSAAKPICSGTDRRPVVVPFSKVKKERMPCSLKDGIRLAGPFTTARPSPRRLPSIMNAIVKRLRVAPGLDFAQHVFLVVEVGNAPSYSGAMVGFSLKGG
jgi:hypothetical protein